MAELLTRDLSDFAQTGLSALPALPRTDAEAFLSELQNLAHRLNRILRALEVAEGLAPATREVLEALRSGGPRTVPQLARLRGTSRQNVQIMVNRLEKDGWVRSMPNSAHKRSDLIAATSKTESVLESSFDPQEKVAALMAQEVSRPDLIAGLHLLARLKQLLHQIQAPENSSGNPAGNNKSPAKHASPGRTEVNSAWQTEENELPVNLL